MGRMVLNQKSKLIFLVVIYNKVLENIQSISSFMSPHNDLDALYDREVIVWDNSTIDMYRDRNKYFSIREGYNYFSEKKNCSLSYIYNKVVHENSFDYIVISDDDTCYDIIYLSQLYSFVKERYLVAVPQVYSQERLFSPAKLGIIVGKHISSVQSGPNYGLIAITSGVIIKKEVFEYHNVKFDENLSLYGIDTDFFIQISNKIIPLFVLDARISHDLSMESESSKSESSEVKKFRFENNKKATIYINKKRSFFIFLLTKIYYFLYENIKGKKF
ncbi:glycosyltransferase family protein [Aeromonas dhakensis]|uniref:glycosyltransferase n=1 Tax=Aeromonas dhakensis TaxID=196024 RepID=UPI00288F3694|nr:glycosyltransferase [Aeromonas dhakensis]HDX9010833.1 glycosyltransferase [Aeromonas dhakensis]